MSRSSHRELLWDQLCNDMYLGKPSGNAEFAQSCRQTPLVADAILNLLWSNLEYFGDPYYNPITIPIQLRVEEFYEMRKEHAAGA